MSYKISAWLDVLSLCIELVILLGNILGGHNRDRKGRTFLIALFFVMLATLCEATWNFISGEIFDPTFAKGIVISTIIFGMLSEVFTFYYLVALFYERGKISMIPVDIMIFLSTGGIIFSIWGTFNNKILIYSFNHVYHGPFYSHCIHVILVIGIYTIGYVLFHAKVLGIKDTLVTLSYFVLPIGAIALELMENKVDLILPAASISMLILNNLLQGNEIRRAEMLQEIAEVSEKNKSRFLANMSHEIRTPINAVLGLNEMIIRESKEPEIIAYAHDIKSAGGTLLSLVNDVLDFSKIESGKMELVEIDYDISSVLNDIVNMTNGKAEEKGLSFQLEVDGSLPRILHGDEVRIKQIMTNLLSNAVKYTKIGSVKLSVNYDKVDDFAINLRVSVEDTGMGIKPEDMERLFTPFSRIDEKKNNSIEGTGLGMTITKHFLELMDSKLDVNTVYGSGTTVSFVVRQEVKNWENMGDYKEAFYKLRNRKDTYQVKVIAPDARILVVDDMPMNLTVCRGLLKSTQVKVDTAASGEEALELMHYNHFDLIYLDHMMPGIDGIETLKRLKADRDGANLNTPVIVLTANAVSGAREEYMEQGFDDYLTKPINPEKLERSLISFLPKEMITIVEQDGLAVEPETTDDEGDTLSRLRRVPLLSVDDGIQASGDEEVYLIAGKEFTLTIEPTAEKIQRYYNEGDIKNYEIQVHGLKSTSRIMGDLVLSEMARELEFAAKDEKHEIIDEKTGALLERINQLKEYLVPIFLGQETKLELPMIDEAQLKEAISLIKQALDEFDFDSVSSIMKQLSTFRHPEDFEPIYKQMQILMAEVDYDGMNKLFEVM